MNYKLRNLCEIKSSKRIYASQYTDEGIPFWRGKEVIEMAKNLSNPAELHISPNLYNQIRDKYGVPNRNDILLTAVGTIGINYLVKSTSPFYFKDGNVIWLTAFSPKLNPIYLHYYLQSDYASSQINSVKIGSTQQALTIESLGKIDLDLPCIEEQQHIVGTRRQA